MATLGEREVSSHSQCNCSIVVVVSAVECKFTKTKMNSVVSVRDQNHGYSPYDLGTPSIFNGQVKPSCTEAKLFVEPALLVRRLDPATRKLNSEIERLSVESHVVQLLFEVITPALLAREDRKLRDLEEKKEAEEILRRQKRVIIRKTAPVRKDTVLIRLTGGQIVRIPKYLLQRLRHKKLNFKLKKEEETIPQKMELKVPFVAPKLSQALQRLHAVSAPDKRSTLMQNGRNKNNYVKISNNFSNMMSPKKQTCSSLKQQLDKLCEKNVEKNDLKISNSKNSEIVFNSVKEAKKICNLFSNNCVKMPLKEALQKIQTDKLQVVQNSSTL